MAISVRKARFQDATAIAEFVNQAQAGDLVDRLQVAERFSQVGFLLAESDGDRLVGLLGWQVENLVVRVTDFLIAPGVDRVVVGELLVEAMEDAGRELQAEAAMLFWPANPSQYLIEYWLALGYDLRAVADLSKAWRQAAAEWKQDANQVMIKQLREDLVRRPI